MSLGAATNMDFQKDFPEKAQSSGPTHPPPLHDWFRGIQFHPTHPQHPAVLGASMCGGEIKYKGVDHKRDILYVTVAVSQTNTLWFATVKVRLMCSTGAAAHARQTPAAAENVDTFHPPNNDYLQHTWNTYYVLQLLRITTHYARNNYLQHIFPTRNNWLTTLFALAIWMFPTSNIITIRDTTCLPGRLL